MSDVLKFSVPGKAEYVSTVRLAVSSLANRAGFDIEAIEDIKVAVSEACSNIICHSEIGEDRIYHIICELSEDKLEICVEDDGVGFDIAQYEAPDLDNLQSGGLGVFLMKALMDDVQVCAEVGVGTSIRMTKFITVKS
jgi:serine/threonine-protein kinase RsbW